MAAESPHTFRPRPTATEEEREAAARRGIGVCLSGGGFRASFFALGALRYLAEANLLPRVSVISSVSGGSIAAAMVADRWDEFIDKGASRDAFLSEIDRPFRDCVTARNLRNRWIGRSFLRSLWPRSPGRGVALGRTLRENLYVHDYVADLPANAPQVVFTSTDLTSGRAFRIARDFVGNYDYGYSESASASIELGTAVAASAAFPMALSVIWLPAPGLPKGNPPATLSLHDGGVYDNLGLEWFQRWDTADRPESARRPDFLIVVNASGPATQTRKLYGAARALNRDLSIQYQQVLALRVSWLIDTWLREPGRGVYVGITREPRRFVYPKEVDQAAADAIDPVLYECSLPSAMVGPLSRIRTDLNSFSEEEAALLSYHGYWSLHARLGMYAPEFAVATPAWDDHADLPDAAVAETIERLVKRSTLWRRVLR